MYVSNIQNISLLNLCLQATYNQTGIHVWYTMGIVSKETYTMYSNKKINLMFNTRFKNWSTT